MAITIEKVYRHFKCSVSAEGMAFWAQYYGTGRFRGGRRVERAAWQFATWYCGDGRGGLSAHDLMMRVKHIRREQRHQGV